MLLRAGVLIIISLQASSHIGVQGNSKREMATGGWQHWFFFLQQNPFKVNLRKFTSVQGLLVDQKWCAQRYIFLSCIHACILLFQSDVPQPIKVIFINEKNQGESVVTIATVSSTFPGMRITNLFWKSSLKKTTSTLSLCFASFWKQRAWRTVCIERCANVLALRQTTGEELAAAKCHGNQVWFLWVWFL